MLLLTTLPPGLEPPPALVETYDKSGKKKKSGSSNNKPHWDTEPYLEVGGGGQVFGVNGNTHNAWVVHGEAGYEYEYVKKGQWPRWGGATRVGGQYIVQAENAEGMDLRVGTFFGPRWKSAGLQVGPDLFYDTWTYGNTTIPEAYGVEIPLTLHLDLGQVRVFGGGSGAFTNNPNRARDWDLPFHEASAFAGLGGTIEGFDVEASYTYRMTAAGEQQTIVLGARVDAETFMELLGDDEDGGGSSGKKKTDDEDDDDSDQGVGGAGKK